MDRYRIDADPNPNFHFDVDPDPDPELHQNDAAPNADDPKHVKKSDFFKF